MGYHVIINEIGELEREIGRKMRDWMAQLNAVLGQLQAFNSHIRENDSGKTAESICSYMEEVHTYLLHELYVLSEEMLERVVMYAEGYYEIEPDTTAGEIAQTSLEGQEEILQKGTMDFLDVAGLLETELAKINDLLPLKAPPTEGVEDSLALMEKMAEDLRVRIGEYEEAHLSQDFYVMEGMTETLQAFMARYSGKQAVVMDSYESKSFLSYPEVITLSGLEAARDYLKEGNPEIQRQTEVFLDRLAAEERMEEGKNKIVGGLLITVSAVVTVVVVVASWGTATPVAASVWGNAVILTSAGMSTAYGMSEVVEGIDLYRLGAEGDTVTIAKNPVRDVVFGGDDDLYHLWGEVNVGIMNLSMMGSGLTGAYRVGGMKSVLAELGKIGLSTGTGAGTQWVLEEKLGMDQTDALLAGLAVSTMTYAGLNRLHGNVVERYRVNDEISPVNNREALNSNNQYCISGEEHYKVYKEMFGAENVEWVSRDTLSSADRLRVQNWAYPPTDDLYLKYKDVYQNNLYFNQFTGEINWPINDGFAEYPNTITLSPGTIIDRYGTDYGTFTSPIGIPYENRALAPGTEMKPYSVFEIVKPVVVQSGEIAPWFDQPGGGIQYILPDTVDDLLDAGILRRIQGYENK